LRDGLSVVAGWWHRWGLLKQAAPQVEAQGQPEMRGQEQGRIASAFLSGGVDSLHMLAHNRRIFPTDHPRSIKQVILVHGFDIRLEDFRAIELAKEHLRPITDDLGVDLVTVRTNLREIDSGLAFWMEMFHGPALSAVGQIAAEKPGYVYIAATFDIPNMAPWGSHPSIDPALSTERITVVHSGEAFSRLQKVVDLGDWPTALRHMRVCTMNELGRLNCGRCEKCVRTLLELKAAGLPSSAFEDDGVESARIRGAVHHLSPYSDSCYRDVLIPLRDQGRGDLSAALSWALRRDRLRRRIKHLDKALLGGGLAELWRGRKPLRR
jgi:hypothetical protein